MYISTYTTNRTHPDVEFCITIQPQESMLLQFAWITTRKQLASMEEARTVLYPISGFHWLLFATTSAAANTATARHPRLRGRLHVAWRHEARRFLLAPAAARCRRVRWRARRHARLRRQKNRISEVREKFVSKQIMYMYMWVTSTKERSWCHTYIAYSYSNLQEWKMLHFYKTNIFNPSLGKVRSCQKCELLTQYISSYYRRWMKTMYSYNVVYAHEHKVYENFFIQLYPILSTQQQCFLTLPWWSSG